MKLTDRLNVLIQATTLSQKGGLLSLDDAVKAKTAIDVISSGNLNQNYTKAINTLIEIAISSQKKGAFSLKDAYMIYLAVDGIENELHNEVNRLNSEMNTPHNTPTITPTINTNKGDGETIITIPPKITNVGS